MPSKSSVPCKRLFSSISTYESDLHCCSGINHDSSRDRGEFTDVVLNHDVEAFNVHRIIICPQSKFFYKACTGEFKESATGVIEMRHLSHIELKKMVHFFYNLDYDEDLPDGLDMSPLQLHTRMFALADQYDIPNLSNMAVEKYSSRCAASWMPMEFLASVQDIYETTPVCIRDLRDMACAIIRKHLPKMLDNKEVAEFYERTLVEVQEFAKDLLISYVSGSLYGDCMTCGSSQPMEALQARCKKCGKGNSGFHLYRS